MRALMGVLAAIAVLATAVALAWGKAWSRGRKVLGMGIAVAFFVASWFGFGIEWGLCLIWACALGLSASDVLGRVKKPSTVGQSILAALQCAAGRRLRRP